MPRPGQARIGAQHIDLGFGAVLAQDKAHILRPARRREPAPQAVRLGHGGAQANPPNLRGQGLQAGQTEREQIAALVVLNGVQLVEDDTAQPGEYLRRVLIGQQQRETFQGLSSACAAVSCADADA